MEPVAVAQMLIRAGVRHEAALAVPVQNVLDDGAGLGDDAALVLDDRRLAEPMDFSELGRRQHRLPVALVADHLVGRAQLLEQPQDALGARVVEVMDLDHGGRERSL